MLFTSIKRSGIFLHSYSMSFMMVCIIKRLLAISEDDFLTEKDKEILKLIKQGKGSF